MRNISDPRAVKLRNFGGYNFLCKTGGECSVLIRNSRFRVSVNPETRTQETHSRPLVHSRDFKELTKCPSVTWSSSNSDRDSILCQLLMRQTDGVCIDSTKQDRKS